MAYKLSTIFALMLVCCVGYVVCQGRALKRPYYWLPDEKASDEQAQSVTQGVAFDVAKIWPRSFVSLEAVSYRSQHVAGTNYLIRAIVHKNNGHKHYLHLRVHEPFRGGPQLIAIKGKDGIEPDAVLEFFE